MVEMLWEVGEVWMVGVVGELCIVDVSQYYETLSMLSRTSRKKNKTGWV